MKNQEQILIQHIVYRLFTKHAFSEDLLGKSDLAINKKTLNIKTILTTVLMMCLVTFIVNSQTLKVTGGVNLMHLNTALESPMGETPTDTDTDLPTRSMFVSSNELLLASGKNTNNESGFYLGLALSDITLFNNIDLQPEVRFVGVKDFNQIQVPVLLNYGITEKFHAFAGPNFAFLLDAGDSVKSFNFALDFGASYNISDKIALDARYDWGQTNLLKNGDSNNYIKINNIQFGIVYRFGTN
ncbi:hypothetical protein A9Q86_16235 [Flavobacteriales bacterium 33_180_T64]|nr:hypothetical protein A9Q86_16235 [Flavobacteriales bacterium 33_180_T64]